VALNVSITFMKAAITGTLWAEAREVSKNFKVGSYVVEVKDDQGDLVATFQGLAYRKRTSCRFDGKRGWKMAGRGGSHQSNPIRRIFRNAETPRTRRTAELSASYQFYQPAFLPIVVFAPRIFAFSAPLR